MEEPTIEVDCSTEVSEVRRTGRDRRMSPTLAAIIADGIYIGGGVLLLILVVIVILMLLRR
jgi:hypothetical protein